MPQIRKELPKGTMKTRELQKIVYNCLKTEMQEQDRKLGLVSYSVNTFLQQLNCLLYAFSVNTFVILLQRTQKQLQRMSLPLASFCKYALENINHRNNVFPLSSKALIILLAKTNTINNFA